MRRSVWLAWGPKQYHFAWKPICFFVCSECDGGGLSGPQPLRRGQVCPDLLLRTFVTAQLHCLVVLLNIHAHKLVGHIDERHEAMSPRLLPERCWCAHDRTANFRSYSVPSIHRLLHSFHSSHRFPLFIIRHSAIWALRCIGLWSMGRPSGDLEFAWNPEWNYCRYV